MPAATERISAWMRVSSSALIRMPPVTPPPNASSEMRRPVRPRRFLRIAFVVFHTRPRASMTTGSQGSGSRVPPIRPIGSIGFEFGPQPEALNLAGCGLRQVRTEVDPARIFVGRELGLAMVLQGAGERFTGLLGGLEHHESFRFDEIVLVRPGHQGGLEPLRVD